MCSTRLRRGTGAGLQRVLHHLRRHAGGRRTLARIAKEFLEAIRAAPPVDGVYFSHARRDGGRRESTIPKAICSRRRARFSARRVPIVVSLDLHGILTDRMLEHSDAIVAYHTYPHVDFFETGQRAARLLLRIMAGEVKPVTARGDDPGAGARRRTDHRDRLVRRAFATGAGDRERARADSPRACSSAIRSPMCRTCGPTAFVVTDDDPARAEREAIRIGGELLGAPREDAGAADEPR